MSVKISAKNIFSLLKESLGELVKNDPLRMAAATAFFTTFALPPILIILIQVFGIIFNKAIVTGELFQKLGNIVGPEAIQQIRKTLAGIESLAHNSLVTIGGILFLLFIATTLFKIIRTSLNQIWKIHRSGKASFAYGLKNRMRSIAVILFAGVFFMIGFITESLNIIEGKDLRQLFPNLGPVIIIAFSNITSLILVSAWFTMLFRFLADGKPSWAVSVQGGIFTSVLFNTGKFIFSQLLSSSQLNTIYGASSSIVLLLLFVFYSSLLLYLGAAFISVLSKKRNEKIKPHRHSIHYQLSDVNEID
jgi:membrane protein